MRLLRAAVDALGVKPPVELGRSRPGPGKRTGRNRLCEGDGRSPAAFEAGSVARGEHGHLVQEEQLRVAGAPYGLVPSLELEQAADPRPRGVTPRREAAGGGIVDPAAAVAHEQAPLGYGDDASVRIDAVLQRPAAAH